MAGKVFEICAARSDALGRGQEAIEAVERLIALDPLREDWQRLALRIYARYQGRDAALKQARKFTALLKSELDVEPEEATSALIKDIASGAMPLAVSSAQPEPPKSPRDVSLTPPAESPSTGKSAPRMGLAVAGWLGTLTRPPHAWAAAGMALLAFAGVGALGLYLLVPSSLPTNSASLVRNGLSAPASRPSFKDCETCPEMVEVPEGFFQMGSPPSDIHRSTNETPQRTVRFAAPFAIGKFEVTVEQFAAFVDASGYRPASQCFLFAMDLDQWVLKPGSFRDPSYPVTATHPATCVNWNDAKAYVAWLADKTDKPYRLATEAEWEYAARAGTTTPFSFGDYDHRNPCDYAKFADTATRFSWRLEGCSSNHGHGAAPVGQQQPNGWGLHDMHGNVWEWVEDCWNASYLGAPADGSAWTAGDCVRRVARGGSWGSNPRDVRSGFRLLDDSNLRGVFSGLRVVRDM